MIYKLHREKNGMISISRREEPTNIPVRKGADLTEEQALDIINSHGTDFDDYYEIVDGKVQSK